MIQIAKCKYSFSRHADLEVFSYGTAHLTRRLSSGACVLSFSGSMVQETFSAQMLLKALHLRLFKHPMLMYQSNELKLFDESEECVSALLQ